MLEYRGGSKLAEGIESTNMLLSLMFMQSSPATPASTEAQQSAAVAQMSETSASKTSELVQPDRKKELLKVRRIYVESFGSSEAAQQLQTMIVASLTDSSRFTVTEEKTKADAILKGFAKEKTSQETHAYGSSTAATASGALLLH